MNFTGAAYNRFPMGSIGQRIRKARQAKRLTQEQLAAHFGISRVSITQWEKDDTRPSIEKYDILAQALGGTPEYYMTGNGTPPQAASAKIGDIDLPELSNASSPKKIVASGIKIPVYGQAVGGVDGEFVMNGNLLYEVLAPPNLTETSGAYAVVVSGDSMSPRYEDGETVFVDPKRRPKRGDYVIAQIRMEEDGPLLAYVKRFARHNAEELVLSQFNPVKELRFSAENVHSVHVVVGMLSDV